MSPMRPFLTTADKNTTSKQKTTTTTTTIKNTIQSRQIFKAKSLVDYFPYHCHRFIIPRVN